MASTAVEDRLDRLPDPILLLVLAKVGDATALVRCSAVSRRLLSLTRQTAVIVLRLPPAGDRTATRRRPFLAAILRLVPSSLRAVTSRLFSSAAGVPSPVDPAAILRRFDSPRSIRLEASAGEIRVGPGELVTWRAEFGAGLDRCAVLGAAAAVTAVPAADKEGEAAGGCLRREERIPGSFFSDGRLKRGVTWTINSLVAASRRHRSLRQIAERHVALERLEFADVDAQGVLTMSQRQLSELRAGTGPEESACVPGVKMSMWFAPRVEVAGGMVLEGATLVAAWPSERSGGDEQGWLAAAFDGPYAGAVRQLLTRETYSLEMNSF